MMTICAHPIRQIAYFVPDVRVAARDHMALYGSGPFFVADNIPLAQVRYRGEEAALDHSSAYGQWGDLMVEFVQQNNPGASVFHDLYPDGGQGIHHVALIVDDLSTAQDSFERAGMVTALKARMMDGFTFVMMDAAERYGHMIELYEGTATLTGFYDMVRRASVGFDGADPIRTISL